MSVLVRVGRFLRGLGVGRSALRRRSDRIESVVLVFGLVGMLMAVVMAPSLATDTYQRQMHRVAVETATRQQVIATVLAAAPPATADSAEPTGTASRQATVPGRWRTPQGIVQTTQIRVDAGTRAGARIPIWIDRAGKQVAQPTTPAGAVIGAILAATGSVAVSIGLFASFYWLTRWLLDRRRMRAWDREWHRVATDWSHRG